jgi:hypothetical protein
MPHTANVNPAGALQDSVDTLLMTRREGREGEVIFEPAAPCFSVMLN